MRRLVITAEGKDTVAMNFDEATVRDSQALNRLLCLWDPGDTYTVAYSVVEPAEDELHVMDVLVELVDVPDHKICRNTLRLAKGH